MDPESGPSTILMTEQSYNLLMPLYADQREDARTSADGTVFGFPYGSRTIVVAKKWDWDTSEDVARTLSTGSSVPGLPVSSDDPILVVAGGWGSLLFSRILELEASGAGEPAADAIPAQPPGLPAFPH